MPGLLPNKQAEPQAQQQPQQNPDNAIPMANYQEEQAPNVSPEEQKVYENFVQNAQLTMYDEKVVPEIVKSLKETDNPVHNLAKTAVMVIFEVKSSAEDSGHGIPEEILFHGGMEIIEDLADFATQSGLNDYSQEDIEAAVYSAMDMYREVDGGGMDQTQAQREIEALKEVDQAGGLGKMFPELASGYEQRFGGKAQ